MRVLAVLVAVLVLTGCSTAVAPDGTFLMALGQSEAVHCPPSTTDPEPPLPTVEEAAEVDEGSGCTRATGGALSDGITGLLRDAFRWALAILSMPAAAAGAATQ